MKKSSPKILLIGIYPPPYGGVSIHIARLLHAIKKSMKNDLIFISDCDKLKNNFLFLFLLLLLNNIKILHVHGYITNKKALLYYFLKKVFNINIILSYHNDRFSDNFENENKLIKFINKKFYCNVDLLISSNPNTDYLFINKEKIRFISPFLKPTRLEINSNQISKRIKEMKKENTFLITANASRFAFYDGKDLYGIDLTINLIKKIKESSLYDIKCIFVVPDETESLYFIKMKKLISFYGLSDSFYFFSNVKSYTAIINYCDIFLRPTNTDGDSISVREALFFRKPTIASDVCVRPKGTIIFRNRNITDLYDKTMDVLNNYNKYRNNIKNLKFENNSDKILNIYNNILNGN